MAASLFHSMKSRVGCCGIILLAATWYWRLSSASWNCDVNYASLKNHQVTISIITHKCNSITKIGEKEQYKHLPTIE